VRQGRAGAAHGGKRFSHHPFHELVVGQRFEAPADGGRGVVHQHIETAEGIHGPGNRLLATLGGEQIRRDGLGLDALFRDGGARGLERRPIAAADGDIGTFAGKSQRDGEADTAIATRYQDGFIFQSEIHL
jgi:hypothetical protein